MNFLITGQSGYIARHCGETLSKFGKICYTSRSPRKDGRLLDLSDPSSFDASIIDGDSVVLLLAAVSSPDFCSQRYAEAYGINVSGTQAFIETCLDQGARVVFFSSDTVYGHTESELSEEDEPHPVGEYAEMKFEIETRFAADPAFKVLRLSYVLSRDDKFTAYLAACTREGKRAEIYHPILRRVVYLHDLLDIVAILCRDWNGIPDRLLNVGGPDLLSRLDMAELFRKYADSRLDYHVVEPPASFFSVRPKVINISAGKLQRLLGRPPTSVATALQKEFDTKKVSRV